MRGVGRLARAPWWGRVNAPLVAAAGATAVCLLLYAGHAAGAWTIPALEGWERYTVDARFRLRGARAPADDRIVIVGLDDRTRRETDIIQSRRGWAKLIDALAGYRPRAVGIDAFFSSPEVNLTRETVEKARRAEAALADESPRSPAAEQALAALRSVLEETRGDEVLARAIERAGNIYLGVLLELGEGSPAPPGSPEPLALAPARYGESVRTEQPPSRRPARAAAGVTGSMKPMVQAAAGAGFVNVDKDDDGHVRAAYLVIEQGGRYYMPLAMSLALAAQGHGAVAAYVAGEPEVHVGARAHATNPNGKALLSYLGEGGKTFPHISAADVVSGEAPKSALAGKLVLVGYTDVTRDVVATPFDPQLHGVELHATLVHNLLHGGLMRRAGPWTTLLIILLGGAALTLLQLRRVRHQRAWLGGIAALILVVSYFVLAQVLFVADDLVVDVVAPILSLGVVALGSLTVALATEGRERSLLRHVFSQYVQDTVVARILDDPRLARLGGVRRDLTVLFADIRGFSRISESLEPEVLSQYLNEYFTPMTDLVMREGGMLDKYIGDALMAVFGAPLEQRNHAERACRSALVMLEALDALNERWRAEGVEQRLAIGVGINSGPMAVGNMGSERRFNYTVIGDAVNLGARLEALTREYRVDVLCGESTAEAAGDAFVFRELDVVRVKGRDGVARIFELVGTRGDARLSEEDLIQFDEALAAYRTRDWTQADEALGRFLETHPGDGPAEVLRERVRRLREDPPGEDWDGVFVQVSK